MNDRAFEYVAGTLRGRERAEFEQSLAQDEILKKEVGFWEGELIALNRVHARAPKPQTWENIQAKISPPSGREEHKTPLRFSLLDIWRFGIPSFAAIVLMFVLFGYYPGSSVQAGLPDYIAVLTDDTGQALLTALSSQEDGRQMTLKWEDGRFDQFDNNADVQLWAISRRDGQIRPLAVFDKPGATALNLDEAAWRLVTDAQYLILTEEEEGGSAIDEPSDMLLAKGFCVRLRST